ncbi:hypothetical protein Daus18300_009874 [Diaporthe australafricana]|uniref:AB hydrolase-1 domain-containing protein n=1 Tax=Diaporthe australafricana TaxID=127596 RepID=A0ABR3WCC8_9PEZI
MGVNASGIGWDADVKMLLEHAERLFAQGQEIVLAGHSYGGIPACVATRVNSVAERAERGLSGGFRHIVFIAAFAMPFAGVSLLGLMPGGQCPDWQQVIESDGLKQVVVNEKSKALMYNDLSPEKAQELFDALVPQSHAAQTQPVDFASPDIKIPKTYIVCEDDLAFPTASQRDLSTGPDFNQVSVSGGHSAFCSIPDELADALVKIAGNGE